MMHDKDLPAVAHDLDKTIDQLQFECGKIFPNPKLVNNLLKNAKQMSEFINGRLQQTLLNNKCHQNGGQTITFLI
jgi:hypothetical protein